MKLTEKRQTNSLHPIMFLNPQIHWSSSNAHTESITHYLTVIMRSAEYISAQLYHTVE